jgi:hypothetical protein
MKHAIMRSLFGTALLVLVATAARAEEVTAKSILIAHKSGAAADVWDRLRELEGDGRAWIVNGPLFAPEFAPKLASFYQVRSLDDYESITLRRQAQYFTYLVEGRVTPANRGAGQNGRSPLIVQRRITRTWCASSKPVARCRVQRLSHTMHSRGLHTWV